MGHDGVKLQLVAYQQDGSGEADVAAAPAAPPAEQTPGNAPVENGAAAENAPIPETGAATSDGADEGAGSEIVIISTPNGIMIRSDDLDALDEFENIVKSLSPAVTGGKRYTVLRVNHPDNPGETRGSERDYGRFGDYFEYDLTPDNPLRLKYRVWVQEGEMTVEQCNAIASGFVNPP